MVAGSFLPHFSNPYLERLEDSAVLTIGKQKLCFTTDSYVVSPIFFPGGNIGSLAVHGTVNDLAVCGGKPLFMSTGFILEEGFPFASLETIIASMAKAAKIAGISIVTGDTKVVPRGAADGIFINTSGIGIVEYAGTLSIKSIKAGDAVILNGTIGDHGAAIIKSREIWDGSRSHFRFGASQRTNCRNLKGQPEHPLHARCDTRRAGAILAEIAKSANIQINISEQSIPVQDNVRGICEILGLDPLYLANEGKMVLFCPASDAAKVLTTMKKHKLGVNAAVIGNVAAGKQGRVVLKTSIGGERIVDLPTGELVPRIC